MIASHQPNCFPDSLVVGVSSRQDGTMLDRSEGFHSSIAVKNRKKFCVSAGMDYDECVYQKIKYDKEATFDHVVEVYDRDKTKFASDVYGDGLFTSSPGVGLFLPVADCVATILHDPIQGNLALLHMGRHSTLTDIIRRIVELFEQKGSRVEDIIVWMSPSAKKGTYKLKWFNEKSDKRWEDHVIEKDSFVYIDLPGYNKDRLMENGILEENIFISSIDTVLDSDYFSHSAGDLSERIAVAAMMK